MKCRITISRLLIILLLCHCIPSFVPAQKVFLRIYDSTGKCIYRGRMLDSTDSSLVMLRRARIAELHYREIGYIRTERSFGHRLLISSAVIIPVTAASIFFFGNFKEPVGSTVTPARVSGGDAMLQGAAYGLAAGAALSGFAELFRKDILRINGNPSAFAAATRVLRSMHAGK
jgi:hypothetical protein